MKSSHISASKGGVEGLNSTIFLALSSTNSWLCRPHLDIPVGCERGEELELHLYWAQLGALLMVELEGVPTQGAAQVHTILYTRNLHNRIQNTVH